MNPRPTGPGRLAAAAAALLLLAACSESDTALERADRSTTTAPSTTSAPADGGSSTTAPTPAPTVEWTSCGTAECATVAVPLDHEDPSGPSVDLAVLRLPARGDRIGPLFVNFGGPGSGTIDLLPTFPFPEEVRERFDIVAIDPRGVGGSVPLDCGVDPTELYAVDPTVEDDADVEALVGISRRYADDCEQARGDLLPHVGTRDVARDMDLVRAGMGDEQLSFVGYSYGTSIGQAYADLFPRRVRSLILDGVVDPAPSGLEVATQQARGFEAALDRWAAGCGNRDSCSLGDPVAAVDQLLAAAEAGVPSSGGRDLGPGEAAIGLAMALYNPAYWPTLDGAVAGALAGDGTGIVALADQYTRLVDFSTYFAVSCLDSDWPERTAEHLAAAEAAGAASPRFGEAIVNDYLRCAVWPAEEDPLGAITAPGTPPVLVVSTTGDPATPYESGVAVADRLAGGVLLTHEGDGHTIVFQGSQCVDRVAIDYLVDGTVPGEGTTC
ncbi:MAG TPA: alpha/beta hydrolase [Acidimicrobiales bacterium]|nr:alpha/beta hydrolase [Acidimicrobiales bacterium]